MSQQAGAIDEASEDRAPSAPPPDPLIGRTLDGRYRIEAVLGEGGMGLVYRARHAVLNKPLAIKVLRPEVSRDTEVMTRFQQEAQSASGIGNQHIIDISDFGRLPDGSTYFVMEFLDGKSLTSVIEEQRPISPARVVHIAKQLCEALGAAHDQSIVHRDLKPDNIYLIKRGQDRDFVKVLDFGIAKVGGASSKLTKAGQVFGTPHYMSPEQCAGTNVDQRTDIYAIGVILYEMASGRVPFDADNLMGILTKHMYEAPIPPRELSSPVDVPPELEAVIMKCLAKSADVRYQSMSDMRTDIERIEAGITPQAVYDGERLSMVRADATGRMSVLGGEPPAAAPSRTPLFIGLGLVVMALVGGGLAFALAGPGPTPPATTTTDPVVATPLVPTEAPPTVPAVPTPPTTPEGPTAVGAVAARPIHVEAETAGATLFLENGDRLGDLPLDVPRPEGAAPMTYIVRAEGFEERRVAVLSTSPEVLLVGELARRRSSGVRTPTRPTNEQTPTPHSEPGHTTMQTTPRGTGGTDGLVDPWENSH